MEYKLISNRIRWYRHKFFISEHGIPKTEIKKGKWISKEVTQKRRKRREMAHLSVH